MRVRVVLVSDAPLYRDGVARTFAGTKTIDVVATAGCGKQALEFVHRLDPDVVLLDMAMPHSFDVARQLASIDKVRVVALAVPEVDCQVIACAEVGIAGYVPRGGSVDDAVEVMEAVVRGEAPCSPHIVSSLWRRIAALSAERHNGRPPPKETIAGLTAREMEILALLRQGFSNKMISHHLGIELATVKNHVHSVFSKLGLRRRAEAALLQQNPQATETLEREDPEPVH
jgi:DNA-binding NarL/FixJ family response regulator